MSTERTPRITPGTRVRLPAARARLPGDGQSYTGSRCASPFSGARRCWRPDAVVGRCEDQFAPGSPLLPLGLPLRVARRQLDKRPRGGRPSNVPTCAAAQTAICRAVRLPGGKPDGEPWSEHPGELWLRGGGDLRRDDGPGAFAPARSPRTLGGVGGPQCADIACALVAGLVAAGGNREPAAQFADRGEFFAHHPFGQAV
jgi:hypothetical protein